MQDPDAALSRLRDIISEFAEFCKSRGGASEADTRAKIIDEILTGVLDWPESALSREDHVRSGYIDYTLSLHDQPYLAVEAKKEGHAFTIPHKTKGKRYTLDGALVTNQQIKRAIDQVRQYCDDAPIPIKYAVVTNGYTWIVFRAVREDIGWRKGRARVFVSLESIAADFTDFWNLLSYGRIELGSLQTEFTESAEPTRRMDRVIDRLFNADLPLQRNRLNTPLQPLITSIFEDIADQDQVEVLQSCYVHTGSLKIVQNDLDHVITDSIPHFLAQEGTRKVGDAETEGGFEQSFAASMGTNRGRLFLLLGGIGSGKTTFLKRYQRTTANELLAKETLWFAIDFLRSPLDPAGMERFVWQTILDDIRLKYKGNQFERFRTLREIFDDHITILQSNVLSGLKPNSQRYQEILGPYMLGWQADISTYVPRLLQRSCQDTRKKPVLFIDNVDQLSPEYQAQIFLLGQRITREIESITVVSLREESYYTASIQKRFTAFTSHKFHIASPRFRLLIKNRINYAIRVLAERSRHSATDDFGADYESISHFLRIVGDAVFSHNKKIVRFIEATCYGNMRLALQLFTMFLTSGATAADKMVRIYQRDGEYNVPFHEFLKSVMLGDRRYYKEDHSTVMNLFNVGSEKNSSHFTSFRLINFLETRRGESSEEGVGYVPVAQTITVFGNRFNNHSDVARTLNRLVKRQLVEANTRSTESIEGASHIRVTSAGIYYARTLARAFAYLDLVLQDTPLNDAGVEAYLRQALDDVDNLSDREEVKLERVRVRFDRVEKFLSYLATEENRERAEYALDKTEGVLSNRIVWGIAEAFQNERKWIESRIVANRERYGEETFAGSDPPDHADEDIDDENLEALADQDNNQGALQSGEITEHV